MAEKKRAAFPTREDFVQRIEKYKRAADEYRREAEEHRRTAEDYRRKADEFSWGAEQARRDGEESRRYGSVSSFLVFDSWPLDDESTRREEESRRRAEESSRHEEQRRQAQEQQKRREKERSQHDQEQDRQRRETHDSQHNKNGKRPRNEEIKRIGPWKAPKVALARPMLVKEKLEWLAACSAAFADKSQTQVFPEPPSQPCINAGCALEKENRALKAWKCNIREIFAGRTTLKTDRLIFHPDKFSARRPYAIRSNRRQRKSSL